MTENTTNKPRRTGLIVGGIVVLALVVAGLLLPPISLLERLSGDAPTESASGLSVPGEITVAVSGEAQAVNVASVERDSFLANPADVAGTLPSNLTLLSNVYTVEYDGAPPTGRSAVALPQGGDAKTIDLYGWNGVAWEFVPSTIDETNNQLLSNEGAMPEALAIVQTASNTERHVATLVPNGAELPVELLPLLTDVSVGSLMLGENGTVAGDVGSVPTGAYDQWLHVTNVNGTAIDQQNLTALLSNTTLHTTHATELLGRALAGGFVGIHIDYQGVQLAQREAFTTLIQTIADNAKTQNLQVAVTFATPQQISGAWTSAGQDWAAVGQVADVVYAQLPLDPTAYADNGLTDQMLDWATRQVSRYKLNTLVSAGAIDGVGFAFSEKSNEDALAPFGELQFTKGSESVEAGTAVDVSLSGTANALEWDTTSYTYKYTYQADGQTHVVWLANVSALANRLRLANRYNLAGVSMTGLADVTDGNSYASAINSYLTAGDIPQPEGAAIVWTVTDGSGSVLASSTGEAINFSWEGTQTAGDYTINANFAMGNDTANLDSLALVVASADDRTAGAGEANADGDKTTEEEPTKEEPAEEETTEEEVAEEVTEEEPAEGETTEGETTEEEPTEEVIVDPNALESVDAVVGVDANIRVGPGIAYGLLADGATAGTPIILIGRSTDSNWLKIILPDDQEGWIYTPLVNVATGVVVADLPIGEVDSPLANPAGGGGEGGGNPAQPPSAPPPIANLGGFELGGQTQGMPASQMQLSGMTWIKRQHKWSPGNRGTDVQGLITEGHNAGFKVLLSMPGQLNPSSIDYASYVQFLGEVAALPDPPDAIEVWNEMNIEREWPLGQISPQSYVQNMLIPGYTAIKNANPNIMVITGAPAPTGFFGGSCGGNGCDDAPYIAGMMAAGAGNYSDCIGVHYNEGIMPPSATSGDPRGNGGHYTRYFQGMINAYRNAGAGRLCFTELGYLSGEEWGSLPGGFLWKGAYNLTVAEHAQYLAQSVQVAVNNGNVRMIIVFNVDFTTWGDDPQAGYAMIRPNGGCPACQTLGQVMGALP